MELHGFAHVRHALPIALALGVLTCVLVLLGYTYFGHGASPYDTCTAPNGRTVSCELLSKAR